MIIYANVENSEILIGAAEETSGNILMRGRVSTRPAATADEYALTISELLRLNGLGGDKAAGGIVASCVPPVTDRLKAAMQLFSASRVLEVGPGLKTGVNIRIDDPGELGADLIVSAAAGIELYGAPLIIVALHTLTTFSVIGGKKEFLGAIFMPGVDLSARALTESTAALPAAAVRPSARLIGTNTVESMQSGLFFGTAAMIDGITERIKKELALSGLKVVISGDYADIVSGLLKSDVIRDDNLIDYGLIAIYRRNRKSAR